MNLNLQLTRPIAMYKPHLKRQNADLRAFMSEESLALSPSLDYDSVPTLSNEVRERLKKVQPLSIVSEVKAIKAL